MTGVEVSVELTGTASATTGVLLTAFAASTGKAAAVAAGSPVLTGTAGTTGTVGTVGTAGTVGLSIVLLSFFDSTLGVEVFFVLL